MKEVDRLQPTADKDSNKLTTATRKSIKSVKELPSWFNITKYQAAKEMEIKGWYNQLTARETYLRTYEGTGIELANFLKNLCRDYLAVIKTNPFIEHAKSMTDTFKSTFNLDMAEFKTAWRGIYSPAAVQHTGIFHIYTALREKLSSELYQLLVKWWEETCPADGNFFPQSLFTICLEAERDKFLNTNQSK